MKGLGGKTYEVSGKKKKKKQCKIGKKHERNRVGTQEVQQQTKSSFKHNEMTERNYHRRKSLKKHRRSFSTGEG